MGKTKMKTFFDDERVVRRIATLYVCRVAQDHKYKKRHKSPGGTKIYEYSDRHVNDRNKGKAQKVEKLRHGITKLRGQVHKDLKSKDEKTRATALAVGLMDATYERIGNPTSAKEGHFGVTGWKAQHITFSGGTATIKYVGKSGVKHEKVISTPGSVAALKAAVKGKRPGDTVVDASAEDVNGYLKPFGVTAKDIRGFHANTEMQTRLKAIRSKGGKLPTDKKEREKALKEEFKKALAETAEAVGHEAATLKSQYLVPGLESDFLKDGTVNDKMVKKGSELAHRWLKTAIININNATDGPEGDLMLRGDYGLQSSLTYYEQAIMQDLIIHHHPILNTPEGYTLRGHKVGPSAVCELMGAGYLEDHGGEIYLSPMYEAKQKLYRTASSSRLILLYERHYPPEDRSIEHYAAWRNSLTLPMARTAAYDIIRHCPHCQCVLHDGPRYHEHCDDCGYDVDFPGGRERLKDGEWTPIPEDDPRLVLFKEKKATQLDAFEKMWRTATKTHGEREDEEAERLLRPEPKKKPPRNDLRREQMNTDKDKDTESEGADGDKDLSLNYKRIALRWLAAAGEHKPGEVWQTESGWAGQNPDGVPHTFKDRTKAEAYAKGQSEAPEDEEKAAPEEEQSPETTPQPEEPKKKPKPRKDPEQVRFDRKVQREVKNLRAERKGVKDAKVELRQAKKDLKEARAELKATQKGTPGYVIAKDTVDTAKELVDQAQEQLDTATESFEATKKRVEEIKSERVERYPDSNTELGRIRLLLREFDQTSDDDNDGSMRAETLEDKLSKYDVASQEQAASAFQKESTSLAHQELTPELVQEIVAAEKQLKKKGLSAEVFGELTARVMFGHSILANPTKVSPMRGVEVDGAEQAKIARDSYDHYSKLNPELRANAFRQAAEELKKHPDDSPDSVHLSRVVDGLYLASVAAGDDDSVRETDGKRLIPEPSGIFKALVKMQKGDDSFGSESGDLVDLMSTEFYGPKGRAALRTRISELDDNDLTNLFTGGDQELDRMIQDALSKMTEPWQRELLRGLMQDLTLDSMTTQHAILTSQAGAEEGPETLKNQGTRSMPKTPEEMDYTLTDYRRRAADAASDEMEALLACLRGHKDSETARQACQEKANAYRIKSHAGFLQLVTDEFGIRDELDPFLVQLRTMLDRQDLAELDFKFVSEGAKTAFTRKTVRAVQSSAYTDDIKARG